MINQITKNIWQLHFKKFGSCVYLIKMPEPILIDTSSKENKNELLENLKQLNINPEKIKSIILTHNHWDHIENLNLFPNSRIYNLKNIKELVKKFPEFKIYKTPGHTAEDICILYKDILFSGDVIFDKNQTYIGRTDLPESVPEKMKDTLNFVKKLKYEILCPGHLI